MRSLINKVSDRMIGRLVPKATADAADCIALSCGCSSLHIKTAKNCCTVLGQTVCSPCIPVGAC
ncbi:hypothetical protein AB0J80_30485 [Actinoplanes sp. NPDC049548]|uniref:hypothetical protein n=1 Tax=Actinoplanes sp. NPDC049548 TaxID=3155152 RepID=UPI003430E1BD